MIDPNIVLQSQTPLQLQGQAMNLQQMQQNLAQGRQNMALGDQRLQSGALALQQQRQEQGDRVALTQAIQASTTTGPDGKPFINHDAVVDTLAKTGHGLAANAYKQQVTELDRSITNLSTEKLQNLQQKTTMAMSVLGSVLQAAPAQKQNLWTQALQQGQQEGLIKPGQYPEQVPDDGTVQSMMYQSMIPAQQIGLKLQGQAALATQKRADAAETRAEAYQQAVLDKNDATRYVDTKAVDKQGHPISLDRKTGKFIVNPDVSVSMADQGAAAGRQITPDANLAAQRSNQTDYEKAAATEQTNLTERDQIGRGLQAGNVYVDAKGKITPFSQMKNAQGDKLGADDIAALQNEMRARYQGATTGAVQANANKNAAMRRNGVQPQVSEQQFQTAVKPTTTPAPQTSTAAAPPADVLAKIPAGKVVTFNNGTRWMKKADGSAQQVTQ